MSRQMKDSGIEWIGEIGENFAINKVKHIFHILDQYRSPISADKRNQNAEVLYDYYGASGAIDKIDGYTIDDHVMLIGEDGANLRMRNLPLMYEVNGKVWVNNHAHILKPKDNMSFRFLFFAMEALDINTYITGSAQPKLSQDNLKRILIPIPPYEQQQAISAYLDRQCSLIDSVIEKTKASIEEYKKLKQAVITQAVTKGVRGDRPMKDSGIEWIGEIPKEWELLKVKWLLDERKEYSEEGKEEPLSMSQKYGILPTKEMDSIPNMASSFVGAKLTYVGDLVFNKLKAHLGVFSVSKYNGLVSPDYAVYYSTGKANVKFLEFLFKTPHYIAEFKKKSSGVGAGLTRLYTGDLFTIPVALPPFAEQTEIQAYIDNKCTEIDTLITKKEQFLTELEGYKKSMIYEYVTGKKEVPQA